MTEATHFSQCVHDQQRRLEAEDCDSIRCAQLISGGRRRIRPPCTVPRSRSPHNVLHSPSNTILLRCYAPLFCDLLPGKRGGGRKPPPPTILILRSTKLCCAVEDKNSFNRHAVAVLKDGRVVGHVHVAINIV